MLKIILLREAQPVSATRAQVTTRTGLNDKEVFGANSAEIFMRIMKSERDSRESVVFAYT